jgi:hypothetical protein
MAERPRMRDGGKARARPVRGGGAAKRRHATEGRRGLRNEQVQRAENRRVVQSSAIRRWDGMASTA